ncbi:MAG: metallophosphoesterase [Spirochaetota bacterium]
MKILIEFCRDLVYGKYRINGHGRRPLYRYHMELRNLLKTSPVIPCTGKSRFIIFSDFHLGSGGRRDDFYHNSRNMMSILRDYYYPQGYHLILNGDIEELQKNKISSIERAWSELYGIFELFQKDGRLSKIFGNHDISLLHRRGSRAANRTLHEGVVLRSKSGDVFVFHGHQASQYNGPLNSTIGLVLKYLAHPLGIKNLVRDYGNMKIHKTEERVYHFSQQSGIISCIGHTHRPLFESLSDIDITMFNIESLLRSYIKAPLPRKRKLEEEIAFYKAQLTKIANKDPISGSIRSIYNKDLIIPVIFNSGCVIGRKAMNGLEISGTSISLVRWNSASQIEKYGFCDEPEKIVLAGRPFYRKTLKQDTLNYIFTRIRMLS